LPANRSRTENWTTSLQQIAERGGCLELAIARPSGAAGPGTSGPADVTDEHPQAPDLLWRVKLMHAGDKLVVERPAAAGRVVYLKVGTPLTASMTIGQNRWVFRTVVASAGDRSLELNIPTRVERCSRREFARAGASVRLPDVRCFPLHDPQSTVAFEAAFRSLETIAAGHPFSLEQSGLTLPDLGPSFPAKLLNISGGGVGLLVPNSSSSLLDAAPFLWMQIDLRPDLKSPLAVAARRAHQHLDANHNISVGLAFEFASHPEHQRFVTETLGRYVDGLVNQSAEAA